MIRPIPACRHGSGQLGAIDDPARPASGRHQRHSAAFHFQLYDAQLQVAGHRRSRHGRGAGFLHGGLSGLSTFLAGKGDIDRILETLIPTAPSVRLAAAKVQLAKADLALAELNLLYTDVVSDIDGQVTRRNVNPGNNVQVGQSLMAVRSMTEIWIDANFKETQLAYLRIGQRVKIEVDMYGSHHEFDGRVTGFTMGTGQTLALLPPQNATGNFVKIVQRLPVRIELTDYNPETNPMFVGLSVTPYVYYKEPAGWTQCREVFATVPPVPQAPAYPKP